MSNLRNTKEFREAVLAAFGVSEDKDVENEENFKRAILDALEVTYTVEDIKNFEKFRHLIVNEVVPAITEGGGSSDFTTAEVTLVNSGDTNKAVVIPVLDEARPPFEPNATIRGAITSMANKTTVRNVPLYKGHCWIKTGTEGDRIDGQTVATSFTVTSGSATSSIDGVDITGDCTITIS